MTESQEQKQLIQWCRTDPRLQYLFHIPNESVGGEGWRIRNRQMGVKSGVPDLFYPVPLHLQKAFASLGYREGDLPVAEKITKQTVCLPIFPEMTEEQIQYVIRAGQRGNGLIAGAPERILLFPGIPGP